MTEDRSLAFCVEETPPDLKDAVREGSQKVLRQWCRANPSRIAEVFEFIHPHHTVFHAIAKTEADGVGVEQSMSLQRSIERLTIWIFILTLVMTLVGIFQALSPYVTHQSVCPDKADEAAKKIDPSPRTNEVHTQTKPSTATAQ